MPKSYDELVLYGRSVECGLIEDLLRAARRGQSESMALHGVAGIGKSALMQYAAAQSRDMRLLQMRGVQAETAMPFAGLHALLRPVRDRIPSLSPHQRAALGAALGIESGEVPGRFLVAAAVVELLAALAEETPVVCLVDDSQWVDPESLAALTFAARRMSGDRLAMLFAVRTDMPAPSNSSELLLADLPRLIVGPLDDGSADQLLDERCLNDRTARSLVKAAAKGNPLALKALGGDRQLVTSKEPIMLSGQLESDYLGRVSGLDPQLRHLLLLAAADDTGDLGVLLTANGDNDAGDVDLAAAEQQGLLTVAGSRVEFVHPLIRSAVYQAAPSTARRRAHLALAEALADLAPSRATWHRAAAAIPPDEALAAELAELAVTVGRRGATDLASRAYERAAEFAADPASKLGWLLDAAEASWDCGQIERAATLITAARATQELTEAGRVEELRGKLEATTGSALHGYEILVRGAADILATDPARAAAMLVAALRAASVAGDMGRVTRAGQLAAQLLRADHHPSAARITAGIAELLTGSGVGGVATLNEAIVATQGSDDPHLLTDAATAAAYTGDFVRTRLLASRAAARCRETGSLGLLAQALESLVVAQIETSPRQAEASADEGLRAARETSQVASAAIHLATLATLAARRGDRASAEDLTQQVFDLDRTHSLAYPAGLAVAARCALELGLGRPAQALQHYDTLTSTGTHRAAQLAATDFAMLAAVWSGQPDRAREMLATIGSWRWVREADHDWSCAALDRWQAMVSEGDEATVLFERSLANQVHSGRPFVAALTHLLLGEHLRRMRQRSDARPHFRLALDTFEHLDAQPWANRARQELRATGESVRKRDDATPRLTPQELQVAELVARGASTKEVAAQLYVSPRTVDSHLRQVFTKLGITARAALRDIKLTG